MVRPVTVPALPPLSKRSLWALYRMDAWDKSKGSILSLMPSYFPSCKSQPLCPSSSVSPAHPPCSSDLHGSSARGFKGPADHCLSPLLPIHGLIFNLLSAVTLPSRLNGPQWRGRAEIRGCSTDAAFPPLGFANRLESQCVVAGRPLQSCYFHPSSAHAS